MYYVIVVDVKHKITSTENLINNLFFRRFSMNKKIISSVLSGCFAMSSLPALAAFDNEVKGTRFEEAVSVLSALKIMNGDENGEYRLDDTIIRSELTKMAVTAMGMEKISFGYYFKRFTPWVLAGFLLGTAVFVLIF